MIEVKFDPTIELPEIRMPVYSETEENDPEGYGSSYDIDVLQQTKVDGVMVPLVRMGNQTIFFTEIVDMRLYIAGGVPALNITIDDQLGTIKNLDNTSWDNTLQLQILPPFDGAYKKINLLFYITSVNTEGSILTISAIYHIPDIWSHRMKAYGEITTYEYMEMTAKEYGLGFCSNMSSTDDKRYIYNPMLTQIDHIRDTVSYAHDSVKESVFDWWIDYWNNLNFINKYSEYKEVLPDDKLQIWTVDKTPSIGGDDNTQIPTQMIAAFSNNPIMQQSQLYIDRYVPEYSSPGVTDRIFDTYSMDTLQQTTTLIENGDVKDNLQKMYTYGGEFFGDYDYLAARAAANMFLSKIEASTIKVSISMPTLGLIRGGKANLWWYDDNNYVTGSITDAANNEMKSNIELPDSIKIDESGWIINKMISGQYYINDMEFNYHTQFNWTQEFTLSRDGSEIEKYNNPVLSDTEKDSPGLKDAVPELSGGIPGLSDTLSGITSAAKDTLSQVTSQAGDMLSQATSAAKGALSTIKDAAGGLGDAKDVIGGAMSGAQNIISGLLK